MDYIAPKIAKSRTQKRQKRLIRNRRRNQQRKLEVKSSKQHKLMRDNSNIPSKQSGIYCTMAANAFWENYKVAHDWQHRHNVVWWKSRCIALENENCILRNKIREQATSFTTDIHQIENKFPENYRNHYRTEREVGGDAEVKEKIEVEDNNKSEDINEENSNVDNEDLEDLEFHVDEDMMKFLEQSIRHKMRLKLMRESEDEKSSENYKTELKIENREALANSKIEDSKLLYGTASTRILAMEAAMQASIDQHNDRSKPHYWPNIPLKP